MRYNAKGERDEHLPFTFHGVPLVRGLTAAAGDHPFSISLAIVCRCMLLVPS